MYIVCKTDERATKDKYRVATEEYPSDRLFSGSQEECEDFAYLLNNARAAREWQVQEIKREAERLFKEMVKSK